MADVKIPITADVGELSAEINKIPGQIVDEAEKAVNRLNKIKWSPIDIKSVARELRQLERLLEGFQRRVGVININVRQPPGIGPVLPHTDISGAPRPSGTQRPGDFPRHPNSGGRHSRTYAPDLSDVGRNLLGGIGGGFGTVANYGTRGAIAGARAGGVLGGGLGLLKGLGIGALAFGALKVGQTVSEGYAMAKGRAIDLDTLKRQMGDLGISFGKLKSMSEIAADGLRVNSAEAAKLAEEFNQVSRGADKSEEALLQSVRTSVGVAHAYGMNPSESVRFFGGMRSIDPRQNNRDLAVMLADTIQRSGMNGRVGEVMQAIQSFAAATSRMSLTAPNVGAFAGAYADMVGARTPGLTGDVANSILSQANSTVMQMGGAGEAGQNFILAALNRHGAINPIAARALAEGGLFGTRSSVFNKNSAIAKFMRSHGGSVAGLAAGDDGTTTFEAIKEQLGRLGGDPWFQLEGGKRLFGVGSLSQAAALMNMTPEKFGGLGRMLKRAGVDMNSLNETGLQTLARIGTAKSKDDLLGIMGDMSQRTGKGALTGEEMARLKEASGKSTEDFRDALLRIAALKDQQETDASKMQEGLKRIDDTQIKIGDKLIAPINTMRDALLLMSGQKSEVSLRDKVQAMERQDITDRASGAANAVRSRFGAMRAAVFKEGWDIQNAQRSNAHDHSISQSERERRARDLENRLAEWDRTKEQRWKALQDEQDKAIKEIDNKKATDLKALATKTAAENSALNGTPDVSSSMSSDQPSQTGGAGGAGVGTSMKERKARIEELEKKYGLPKGMLLGVWGTESSFGKNNGTSSAGARGDFQFMPGTAKQYGVRIGDWDSEADGAARYLRDLHRDKKSWRAALFGYNGAVNNIPAGTKYVNDVQKNGGFVLDEGSMPLPAGASNTPKAARDSVDVNVNYSGQMMGPDGRVTGYKARTSVSVPRGSGSRSVGIEAH